MVVINAISIIILYFLPLLIANFRGNKNYNIVFLLNLFLGWTVLFWFVSLIMAVAGEKKEC